MKQRENFITHTKKSLVGLVFFSLFFLVSSSLAAQISEGQIVNEAATQQKTGASQEQIARELIKKGATPAQLQELRDKYQNQGVDNNNAVTTAQPPVDVERIVEGDDESLYDGEPRRGVDYNIPEGERVYGQNFFSAGNLTFAPSANMPTPANYVLGAGDEVIIDIWGDSEQYLRFTITPDGYITVPGVGRIPLNGLQVEAATARIRSAFSSIYSDLDSDEPRTFLAVSIGNLRTIKVHIMGEVRAPGTYTLTSFASAFHALYSAGGTNRIGSLRNIRVFRNGAVAATIDLYDYLMNGNNAGDITLRDGDIIKVDPYKTLVRLAGDVKRPMRYEMLKGENIQDLIDFAGGFRGEAYQDNVRLMRMGSTEMEIFTIDKSQYDSFNLADGDDIFVGNILDRFANLIEIGGAVDRPGQYSLDSDIKTVKDLVNIAGGTTGDAFMYRVLLTREREDLSSVVESIDLDRLMRGETADIVLKRNDRLYVPSVFELSGTSTVYIGGEVRRPDSYSYVDSMSIEDLVIRAGGFSEAASLARIDVFRRIKEPYSDAPTGDTGVAFSFSIENGLLKSQDKTFVLKPFDQVVVRRSPGYEAQQMIGVEGEVLFAGSYAKLKRDERLSSFIQRAGGLTAEAYAKGARLMRPMSTDERQRTRDALQAKARLENDSTWIDGLDFEIQYVGIDLVKAMENPGGQDDIILREGDVISVPQYDGTVKISGAVLYPNVVTYNKRMRLTSYINQAGGYSRLAMKNKPFVIYKNGKVGTGRWAKIEPGCEIVVPEKPDREPMSLQSILSMSTTVASLVLLISNFVR